MKNILKEIEIIKERIALIREMNRKLRVKLSQLMEQASK